MPTRILLPAFLMYVIPVDCVIVSDFDVALVLQDLCLILMGQTKHMRSFSIKTYQYQTE